MPISVKTFEEKGKESPAPDSGEDMVVRDLEPLGWKVELARGEGALPGTPDLRARRGETTIYIEVKKWSESSPSVGFTRDQFPTHRSLAEKGIACYIAFVAGEKVYYYLSSSPP